MSSGKKVAEEASSLPSKFHIDTDHCFNGMEFSAKELHESLNAYHRKKKNASEWLYNDKTAIFVDANVLLNVYFSPVPLREHLARFLKDNMDRLYMTSQVEREFIRHRLEFIDKNKGNVTAAASQFRKSLAQFNVDFSKLFNDLKTASINAHFVDSLPQTDSLIADLESQANNDNLLSEGFRAFQEKLSVIKERFEEEYNRLFDKVNIEFRDPILTAVSQIKVLPSLSQSEYDFVKDLYSRLLARFDEDKDKYAEYLRFPGSGEDRDTAIKGEPWGDLVIYHQILAFMSDNQEDAIFLTRDTTKRDWMKKGGDPYSYYVADAFRNTGQTLFILPVDEFFPNNEYKSIDEIRMDEDSVGAIEGCDSMKLVSDCSGSEITCRDELKSISEEQFIQELEKYSQWADNYGEKYVSQSYFINVVLGHQGFRRSVSVDVLNRLLGVRIEQYQKEKDGFTIPSIRLIHPTKPDSEE